MVERLMDWYKITSKEKGRIITTKEFKEQALSFSKDPGFRASKGWLQKFRRRHNIKLNIFFIFYDLLFNFVCLRVTNDCFNLIKI